MKKFYILVALFFSLAVSAFALDTIVLLNGIMIDAKIEEVTPTEIKYRRADNLTGPLYTINKNEVLSIKHENGTVEVVNTAEPKKDPKKPRLDPNKLYVGFSLEPSGFISGGPSATVEFSKRAFNSSVHVSFPSLALNSKTEGFGFGAGGSLNYFWSGPIGGFYLGGVFEWNMFPYSQTITKTNPYSSYDVATDSYIPANYSVKEQLYSHNFILGLNVGYKFILGSGMYFRTGITAGWQLNWFALPSFYYKPDIAAGYMF